MATVCEVEQSLFAWAPRESAMDWDNVGHLVGDPEQEVERILVALDITERVVQEAIDCGAQAIVVCCGSAVPRTIVARAQEKGCAVREALEAGKIQPSRYQSYLRLFEELKPLREWQEKRK